MFKSHATALFAQALDGKRVAVGLKRSEFAKQLDVSTTFLTLIETGRRDPGVKLLRNVVNHYPDLQAEVLTYLRDSSKGGI